MNKIYISKFWAKNSISNSIPYTLYGTSTVLDVLYHNKGLILPYLIFGPFSLAQKNSYFPVTIVEIIILWICPGFNFAPNWLGVIGTEIKWGAKMSLYAVPVCRWELLEKQCPLTSSLVVWDVPLWIFRIYIYTIVGIDKMLLCQKAINCVVQCIRPVNFIWMCMIER